jgi:CubicO group peptidase (beta-lactamase class C family)
MSHLSINKSVLQKVGLFFITALLLSGCTIYRRVLYNAPGYNDQFLFDYVEAQAAASPSTFNIAEDPSALGKKIRIAPHVAALSLFTMDEYLDRTATIGFMILRNDSIIFERYDGIKPIDPVTSFSVAKTFVGMLTGIAIEQGLIAGREELVQTYLPDFPFPDIKMRHLLDHTSGIDYPAEGWLYYGRDLSQIIYKLKRRWPIDTDWRYENGNTQVLTLILEKVTGKPIEEYLEEKIWQPMGAEASMHWSTDDSGMPKGYCCMNARTRDFARFGILLANKGNWNGTQLIPEDWISSTIDFNTAKGKFSRYKNQVWLEGEAAGTFSAIGLYGQYIYIYPPKNIVIVRFAKENGHLHAAWSEFFNTVIEQL